VQVEPRLAGGNAEREVSHQESLDYFKEATSRPFLVAGGLKRDSAVKAIEDGKADAVVFGESACLVHRLLTGLFGMCGQLFGQGCH
jgi:2,4-dienoyl-CoA reductase-like NADH-dependent reductase (Old Yellow Enzyme family)